MESKKAKPIVEEREEKMVCVEGGEPTLRKARFLNPFVKSVEEAMEVPLVSPLVCEVSSFKQETWPLEVQFNGWRAPQRKWKQWVDKLVQIHEPIWRKVCIYDAIMASTYEVRKNENVVLALTELWCGETNTFIFPWGEATITLEDVLILGGFPVLGEPVTSPLNENLLAINERLNEERQGFHKQKAQKPDCGAWINYFMEKKDIDGNLEHVAFLVLWLSRYVFQTHPRKVVGKHVFSIAIHLAQGTRIALAPAVLSSLYRDLGLLNQNAIASNDVCEVWALFHLVEMWAWEHFPLLRPIQVNPLRHGEPRVARWHKLSTSAGLQFVRSVLKEHGNFQWRCYTKDVTNWRHPSFYKEKEMWVVYDSYIDDELRSFARCLRACELVGLDCIEQYLPHRVAMQFGLDQHLPGYFTRANSCWVEAWRTYDNSIKKAEFFIPPRLFKSDVTTRYFEWRKQSMRCRKTSGNIVHQGRSKDSENEDQEENHGSVPSKCRKLNSQVEINLANFSDDDEMPLSQRFKLSGNRTGAVNLAFDVDKFSSRPSSTRSPTALPSIILTDMETNKRFSTMVTMKNVSNKGNKSGVSGENCSDCDEIPPSQRLKLSRNNTGVVNLAVGMDKPSSSTQSSTSLPSMPSMPSTIPTDMEINRRFSSMATKKNVSDKGNKNGISGENDKRIREEDHTSRTVQDTELENRVLELEKEFADIKARLMAKLRSKCVS